MVGFERLADVEVKSDVEFEGASAGTELPEADREGPNLEATMAARSMNRRNSYFATSGMSAHNVFVTGWRRTSYIFLKLAVALTVDEIGGRGMARFVGVVIYIHLDIAIFSHKLQLIGSQSMTTKV